MSVPGSTLYGFFLDSARRRPADPALLVGEHRASYRELAQMSQLVAGLIREAVPSGAAGRVGLLTSRGLPAYAGYLGALRAGAAVVPLNPAYPPERLRHIARACALDLVIVDEGTLAAPAPAERLYLDSDRLRGHARDRSADPSWATEESATGPDDLAYVLFTSGSTGQPKGVPIRNANLDAFVRHHIARYQVGPGCRLSQTFDLAFDPSVFDMFVAWGGGATLVVPERMDLYEPVDFVNRRGVTHWYSVPSVISMAEKMEALPPGGMPGLRWSLFAGERLTLPQAAAWAAAAPDSRVENLYGPTELTVTVTTFRLPDRPERWPVTSNGSVPIGEVLPHLEYRLLDRDGTEHPEEGELCVRGPQRFAGYLDPRHNERAFWPDPTTDPLPSPPDERAWYRTGDLVRREGGALVHLGRLDLQVKIRGQRVELGEIENALASDPRVREAVVVADRNPEGETSLAAVYEGVAADAPHLRERLRAALPEHMVPTRLVHVEDLPRAPTGKVDRDACHALLRTAVPGPPPA